MSNPIKDLENKIKLIEKNKKIYNTEIGEMKNSIIYLSEKIKNMGDIAELNELIEEKKALEESIVSSENDLKNIDIELNLLKIQLSNEEKERDMLTFHIPDKGKDFTEMIKNILLTKGNMKDIYVENLLTTENNMKIYENAFTSNSVNAFKDEKTGFVIEDENSSDNYNIYKFYGENIFENFMTWYICRRFNLKNASDVKIVARIKINYGPKITFANISEKLGFLKYISASDYEIRKNSHELLQNVFSSFIGSTCYILDKTLELNGVGFAICYDILSSIFDDINIIFPSKFEELDDPITILKQFFDKSDTKKNIGTLIEYEYLYNKETKIHLWRIKYKTPRNHVKILSEIESNLTKDEAKKNAALKALEYLEKNKLWNENKSKKTRYEEGSEIIIKGSRSIKFKNLIIDLMKKSNIQDKYLNVLTSDESMKIYNNAFTSNSANLVKNIVNENSPDNYEIYETIGDSVFKNFICFYIIQRFNFLSSKDVKILAKIKIKYGSDKEFFPIANELGFLEYITASKMEFTSVKQKEKLLEDVFEAFFGATCYILDSVFRIGVGYSICYDILKYIYDKKEIPLEYAILNDPISIIKEFFDKNKDLGTIEYVYSKKNNQTICKVELSKIGDGKDGKKEILGSGKGSSNKDCKPKAAEDAIINLKKFGYVV